MRPLGTWGKEDIWDLGEGGHLESITKYHIKAISSSCGDKVREIKVHHKRLRSEPGSISRQCRSTAHVGFAPAFTVSSDCFFKNDHDPLIPKCQDSTSPRQSSTLMLYLPHEGTPRYPGSPAVSNPSCLPPHCALKLSPLHTPSSFLARHRD